MDLARMIRFNPPLGPTGQPLCSDPLPWHIDSHDAHRHVTLYQPPPPSSFSIRLSRPCSPHFPFTLVQMQLSARLTSHPRHAFLSDFEHAATSPYSTLPRLAIPVHRRPPAVIGFRWIAAALHCSSDSHLHACFPSSHQLWCVAHLPHFLPCP
jgi:hypothetical protein